MSISFAYTIFSLFLSSLYILSFFLIYKKKMMDMVDMVDDYIREG